MTAQIRDFLINHIVDRLTEYLVLDNNIDITAALKIVYESKIYQQLQDIEGGTLYSKSFIHIRTVEERIKLRTELRFCPFPFSGQCLGSFASFWAVFG